jgi:hypothetical protein
MYVAIRTSVQRGKTYHSAQIVEGYRNEDGQARQKTLLDISSIGMEKILAVKAALSGKKIVNWDSIEGLSALDFGIPYVVEKVLDSLDFSDILGEDGKKHYPTILAMIANRIDSPCAKYSLRHWARKTSLWDYSVIDPEKSFHHDSCYEALDYLEENQERLEDALYQKREKPARLFLYDITSSYFEGRLAELARFGYSRDHRGDRKQIVIGLVTDSDGLPLCVEVFEGNTRDSSTVIGKINDLKKRFMVEKACFIGDRGMRTDANVDHIRSEGLDFILAISHREVLSLVEEHGPRQMGLFDERGIADASIEGRRLVVCRNPIAGEDTLRRREELMRLTGEGLEKIRKRTESGRLKKADAIRKAVDRYLMKWKMEKFFRITIEDGVFKYEKNQEAITAAARLDGVYVIETSLAPDEMPTPDIQSSYKLLQIVERAFRATKDELCIRPVYHWKESRIRGHVFLCFLAYLVERRLQLGLAKLPEESRPEWKEVIDVLRGWRRITVAGRPDLKRRFSCLTTELTQCLCAWGIPVPTG